MSLQFRRISLNDRTWMQQLLHQSQYRGSAYSFGSLYLWQDYFRFSAGRCDDFLLTYLHGDNPSYGYPAGSGDMEKMLRLLQQDAKENGQPLRLSGVTKDKIDFIRQVFGNNIRMEEKRDNANYIYLQEDLANLPGKKYHQKRNHISRFKRDYHDYSFELVSKLNTQACYYIAQEWCRQNNCDYEKSDLLVLKKALQDYEALGFSGGMIRVEGKPVAFCVGEPVTNDTYVVHFEKALSGYNGLYAMINQEFSSRCLGEYRYVNREEDLGIEGLRKAKLSYYPAILLEEVEVTVEG